METPGNYITGYQDFGTTLREQKRAALLNCVPVFLDNLNAAGFNLAEFFLALTTAFFLRVKTFYQNQNKYVIVITSSVLYPD